MGQAGVLFFVILGAGFFVLGSLLLRKARHAPQPHAERRLREDEMDVQSVFDNVTDGVVVLDRNGNIILMNQSAATLLGTECGRYSRSSFLQTFEVFSADGVPVPEEMWPSARARRGEYLNGLELQIRRRDTGFQSIAQISTSPVKDPTGRTTQVLMLYRDITHRRELDHVRTQLIAIVESSEDAIVGKDCFGNVTSWNRGAQKIFGYTAEEMIGQSIKRLLPPDGQEEEDRILARINRGESVDHIEATRVRKDGTRILVSLTISPIRDANGKIVGASKVARDITAQRRMEQQAQQSQKMEAIGQLTGGIAHDFNNLLGVVIGNLDLLEPLLLDNEPAWKRLRTAQKAALRGADLTRRLLAFSCNEELNPMLTSLGDSIRNTLELAGRGLGPEIRIVTHIDDALPKAMVDRAGLETLLLNLLVNARDAMPEGGTLTVTTAAARVEEDHPPGHMKEMKPGRYTCVTVTDTGHGMSRETLERVFEPFFTTKPRGRGTGLGLAMAYGFVRQSGGTVRIYSEVGYGTSVSFYLPNAEDQQEPFPMPTHQRAGWDPAGCTVLIVDDEEDLLEIASVYVEEMGCTALGARDGASALKLLEAAGPIDLMITDIIMPGGMSGAALAHRARLLRPEMKIIYSSGFPADALAERTMLMVDGPLLRKPYQRPDVQNFVRRAISEVARGAVGAR